MLTRHYHVTCLVQI